MDPLGPPLPACGGRAPFRLVVTWPAKARIKRIELRAGETRLAGRPRGRRWTPTVARSPSKRTLVVTAGRLTARRVIAPCAPAGETLKLALRHKSSRHR